MGRVKGEGRKEEKEIINVMIHSLPFLVAATGSIPIFSNSNKISTFPAQHATVIVPSIK